MGTLELTDDFMLKLAREIRCDVSYIGQVANQERWDYKLEGPPLDSHRRSVLEKFGLKIYIEG